MCQQVINLSTACCQQMESVIIFSNLVTSTFSLQKAEPERKPLWTLSTSQGSSRLWRRIWRALLHFCQAAEMQRSPRFPLGLICFHHVYRQGRGVFQLQTRGGRPAEEKCQKKEKAWGPLQKRVHRSRGTQTGSPHYQRASGSASGSVFIWATMLSVVSVHHACKKGFFVLVSFCFFHWGNPIALCTSLPLTTPGSLLSQGWRLWLLASV